MFIYHLHVAMIVNRVFCMPRAARLYPISPSSSRLFIMAHSRNSGSCVHRCSNTKNLRLSAKKFGLTVETEELIARGVRKKRNEIRTVRALEQVRGGGERTVATNLLNPVLEVTDREPFDDTLRDVPGHWLTQSEWPGCRILNLT